MTEQEEILVRWFREDSVRECLWDAASLSDRQVLQNLRMLRDRGILAVWFFNASPSELNSFRRNFVANQGH